jgi:hypothetical protein
MKESTVETKKTESVLTTAAKAIGSTIGQLAAQAGLASERSAESHPTMAEIQQKYYEDAQQQLTEARTLKEKWGSAPPAVQNHLDEIILVYEGIIGRYEEGLFSTQLHGETAAGGE